MRISDWSSDVCSAEVESLKELVQALHVLVDEPDAASFSKYQRLLTHLRSSEFDWNPYDAKDRLVLFSERIQSFHCLKAKLIEDLTLKPNQIAVMHAQKPNTQHTAPVRDIR